MVTATMLLLLLVAVAATAAAASAAAAAACPAGTTLVDTFNDSSGATWSACEDLQQPGGTIALVPQSGAVEWFEKGYEQYANPIDAEAQVRGEKEGHPYCVLRAVCCVLCAVCCALCVVCCVLRAVVCCCANANTNAASFLSFLPLLYWIRSAPSTPYYRRGPTRCAARSG